MVALGDLKAYDALVGASLPGGIEGLLGSLSEIDGIQGSCTAFSASSPWASECGHLQMLTRCLRGLGYRARASEIARSGAVTPATEALAEILVRVADSVERLALIIANYGPTDPLCWVIWRPVFGLCLDAQIIHFGGVEFPASRDSLDNPSERESEIFRKDAESRSNEMAESYFLNDRASAYFLLKAKIRWLELSQNRDLTFARGLELAIDNRAQSRTKLEAMMRASCAQDHMPADYGGREWEQLSDKEQQVAVNTYEPARRKCAEAHDPAKYEGRAWADLTTEQQTKALESYGRDTARNSFLAEFYLDALREREAELREDTVKAFKRFYNPRGRELKAPQEFDWATPGRVESPGRVIPGLRKPTRRYVLRWLDALRGAAGGVSGSDETFEKRGEVLYMHASRATHGRPDGELLELTEPIGPRMLFDQVGLDLWLVAGTLSSSGAKNFHDAYSDVTGAIMNRVNEAKLAELF